MITILYILHSCPYPPNKGDRIRSFNIIKHLSKSYDVKIIFPYFSKPEYEKKNELIKYCSYVGCVKISKIRALLNCILGLFCNESLTHYYFKSSNMKRYVDRIQYDIALVDCSSMSQYVVNKNIPKIIDFVDIDSEKWKVYGEKSKFPKSYIYNREYLKLKEVEDKISKEFDACIVISDQEKFLLNKKDNAFVVKNGIDYHFFSRKNYPSFFNDEYIVFSGAMDYFPNIDGVIFFCTYIFPIIKKEIKNVKFVVAGMNPSKKIKRLESKDIIVTGFVEDIRGFVANASVCVVPLRVARGIQNKILEAMSMGVPVVSTSLANNGINAIDKSEIFIADDPEEFASKVIGLMSSKKLREQTIKNADLFVKQNFDWNNNLANLDEVISLVSLQSHLDNLDYIP